MIDFHYELDFRLKSESDYSDWITRVVESEGFQVGNLTYIFCSDDYLFNINKEYLNHDTFTDIISFDYSSSTELSGDIFISIDRVKDNAHGFNTAFDNELLRIMCHGILHFAGYGDKSETEVEKMRVKEDEKINMFHVEL